MQNFNYRWKTPKNMKNGDLDYGQVSFLIFSKKYTVLGTKKKEPYFH